MQEIVKQSDVVKADQIYYEVGEGEGIEQIKRISDGFTDKLGYRKNGLDKSRMFVLRTDVSWSAINKANKLEVRSIWNS